MSIRSRIVLFLCALMLQIGTSYAQDTNDKLAGLFGDTPQFLPEEQAFAFDFNQQGDTLSVRFNIADGYYLYKKQFKTVLKGVELGEPSFPPAKQIEDEFFGISDVFYGDLEFTYPIEATKQDGVVKLRYQGCAEAGFCYPPTVKIIYLNEVNSSQVDTATTSADNTATPVQSEQFSLADRLSSKENLPITLGLFLLLGIGLAFTPCVFPMYPILSGIVIGQGKEIKLSQAFWMSFIYVQGMAITYSLLGLVVASAGVQFQAALQHPIILGVFITLFVVLAAAMFGMYELQLPSNWQVKLNELSNNQKRGNTAGVFVMGVLSGLVASPCTTAPLTGILLFIAQTGDHVLGFVSLYVLSIGMGIPLILFGMTGGKLLPKAGNWMNVVKVTFGFMMLAVAIFFIERLWNSDNSILLWSLLGFSASTYYFVINQGTNTSLFKGIRTGVIFLGVFASLMLGYQQLAPQPVAHSATEKAAHNEFVVVKNIQDFEQKLAAANAEGKAVMVDLYADWCVACKEFEKYTFPDPKVQAALNNAVWMQIDLTDNTPTNIDFQDKFEVLGLPTILFFNTQGKEVKPARVTGYMQAEAFAEHVSNLIPEAGQ